MVGNYLDCWKTNRKFVIVPTIDECKITRRYFEAYAWSGKSRVEQRLFRETRNMGGEILPQSV